MSEPEPRLQTPFKLYGYAECAPPSHSRNAQGPDARAQTVDAHNVNDKTPRVKSKTISHHRQFTHQTAQSADGLAPLSVTGATSFTQTNKT